MIQSASCFHLFGPRTLRLLSFCKAEHTTTLQKSCFHLSGHYTLPAAVVLQSRTFHCASESSVSIFLGVDAEASVVLQSRTYHCVSESCVSIFLAVARFAASHGSWVVSRRSHQRRQCLDSACILSYAGGENITRESKLKSVSKHFVLHCILYSTIMILSLSIYIYIYMYIYIYIYIY